MYENDDEYGTNYWVSGSNVPPPTPANWTSSGSGSVFDFRNGVRSDYCYQFGNPDGDNPGENATSFTKWNEVDQSDDWGVEGEDWEWEYESFEEGEEGESAGWNSYDHFEEEGYDSVG